MIRFLEPWWLLALLPVAAVAAGYVWRQRRRTDTAVRFTNVALLRTLIPGGLGARRHLAPAALLGCLAVLALALAKPALDSTAKLERATVMLAVDTSLSMAADDVRPTRLRAAQDAAAQFIAELPARYNLGLVSFAGTANVLVPPGRDRDAVARAVAGLRLAEATATGEAVYTCLDAIAAIPAVAGGAPPARIVLLSDGFRTVGRPVDGAASAAAAANVPVSTIAFGTDAGVVEIEGRPQPVSVDRRSLAEVAATTGGHFYEAATGADLGRVYADLGSSLGSVPAVRDLTRWYAGAGLLLGLLAAALALVAGSRLP
ncbi:membrane protein [Pilimelia anulata]|uniref:Membrane protein n=1 Tax=Pilimelia anulata TaxID=53371 RepID=A0A8J3B7E9_9ACTN|nr:VWA domain-containing protein [Pilimelia anulata]GGJ81417.1 membrane protein [Pilimelia anulata]